MSRIIIIDVETTGISPIRGDRVIEIGAVAIDGKNLGDEFSTLISVDAPIHWAAQRVHGISRTMLAGKPTPEEVWPAFLDFAGDAQLVAHNASFDMGFIRQELSRLGMALPNSSICTVKLARKRYPHLPNHRLEAVARHLLGEIPPECRLHRALGDARLLAKVWLEMEA